MQALKMRSESLGTTLFCRGEEISASRVAASPPAGLVAAKQNQNLGPLPLLPPPSPLTRKQGPQTHPIPSPASPPQFRSTPRSAFLPTRRPTVPTRSPAVPVPSAKSYDRARGGGRRTLVGVLGRRGRYGGGRSGWERRGDGGLKRSFSGGL